MAPNGSVPIAPPSQAGVMHRNLGKFASIAAALVILPTMTTALNLQIQRQTSVASSQSEPGNVELFVRHWNAKMIKVLSAGQVSTASDWFFIQGFLDPTLKHVEKGKRADLYYFADLVTDLDPANLDAYVASATYLTIIRNDNEGARDLLLKGRKFDRHKLREYSTEFRDRFWAKRWAIYMTLAYVYLFELNDMPSASRAFQESAEQSDAPDYIKTLSERLKREGGEYEVGIKLVSFMLLEAKGDAKENLEKKKLHLYIAQYRYETEAKFRDYLAKIPRYREKSALSQIEMQKLWTGFRKESRLPESDPWGGRIFLDSHGHVATTTPYDKVFGLE